MEAWKEYDATELVAGGYSGTFPILIDVGTADPNLPGQLKPEIFEAAAKKAGVEVRMASGLPCCSLRDALSLRLRAGMASSILYIAQ